MIFDLSRIQAALLASAALKQSDCRAAALAAFDSAPEFTLNSETAKECFDQEIFSTIFETMQRSSLRFRQQLLDEESQLTPKRSADKLLSELSTLFGIIRRLNGNRLVFDKLHELETSLSNLAAA